MTSFKSLLVATDFSADGNNAVRRAALLAREHGAGLHILHVLKVAGFKPLREWFSPTINIDLKVAQARDALRRVAVEISGAYDVAATTEVTVGDPLETLMQASKGADLVVLGQRGHRRLEGLLGGGTVDRMLGTCHCPVLVIKSPVQQAYRRILVPIDFTACSDAAIQVAAGMRGDSSMLVFHAINSRREAALRSADVPEHIIREARLMEEARTNARMRRKVANLGLDETRMKFALTYGPPVRSTLNHARSLGADLIVAGKQERSTMGGFLLGSVSSDVLSGSNCDMLIVPRPRDKSPRPAASTLATRVEARDPPGNAAPARSAATQAQALPQRSWIHNTAHFTPRRPS